MNCELVFLVNGGRKEHAHFAEQFKIRPSLLIDEDGSVGEAYGLYEVNQPFRDDDYKIYTAPAVVLIDADGEVSCQWLLSGPRGRPSPECLLGVLAYAAHNGWKY
jgi:peroxiredoxin